MTLEEFLKAYNVDMWRNPDKREKIVNSLDEKVLHALMQFAYECAYQFWDMEHNGNIIFYNPDHFMSDLTKEDTIYSLLMAAWSISYTDRDDEK